MAQDGNAILKQILFVVTQIRDQDKRDSSKSDTGATPLSGLFGRDKKRSTKSDTKTGSTGTSPLSGLFGKDKTSKEAKDGATIIRSIFESITNFNKIKINTKKIDATSKALRGLFDTVVYIGRQQKIVINAMKMFDMLAKSLQAMTHFAKAMTVLLMSIGVSILAIAGGIALAGVLLGTKGKPLATMAVIIGVLVGLTTAMLLLGKAKKWIEPGAETADKMGDAMKSLGIGLVVFVGSWMLIGYMMKFSPGPKGIALAALTIVGVIAGMALVFAGLGKFAVQIGAGTAVAFGMATGMAALALGVFAFVMVAKFITNMGEGGTATKKRGKHKGEERGKFGQMMSNIGPGLGMMGIILVSSGLLFAGLGALSWLIIPGVVAGLAIAGGMLLFALATKKLMEISKSIGTPEEVKTSISGMVGSVFTGLIDGVSQALNPGSVSGIKGFGTAIKNTVILMNGIALLMGVSVSLSMFAKALTAFATLDNMRVIKSYDPKTGEPTFGETVNIAGVGQTVTSTLRTFLEGLIAGTTGLRSSQANAIRKMGRALTGRRGILTAVIQFADVLKTFAQFGPEGKIGYIDMIPNGTDDDGNAIFKQEPKTVLITEVTTNITDSFSQFAEGIASGVQGISREQKHNILAMSEALMGKKRGKFTGRFAADKPGLLEPINAFSETLMMYAKFGADGMVPVVDPETGLPTGVPVSIDDIVGNIVTSISSFSSKLAVAMEAADSSDAQKASKEMEKFSGFITTLSTLSDATKNLDKASDSITTLATSVSSLAASLVNLNIDKLQVVASISKEKGSLGSIVATSQENSKTRREKRLIEKEIEEVDAIIESKETIKKTEDKSTETKKSVTTPTVAVPAPIPPINIDELAAAIGNNVAAAFKSGQYTFYFSDNKSGVMSFDT